MSELITHQPNTQGSRRGQDTAERLEKGWRSRSQTDGILTQGFDHERLQGQKLQTQMLR